MLSLACSFSADTLEDELAEPAQAEDALVDEAAGADAVKDVEPDALGLAAAVEAEPLGESNLGPKRSRAEELEVEGGEEEAEAAVKRAKLEDETELVA